jgi:esterase
MQLNYSSYGSESLPALIILHGLFGSSDNWHSFGKIFGEYFHTFTLDARNHGRSPHSEIFQYDAMAEDVSDFIRQRHLSSASLLGHSMGGKTAALTALLYPEIIDKLIVVDIAPRSYKSHHDSVLEALTSLDLGRYRFRKDIDETLAARIPEIPVRQFIMKNLSRDNGGRFRWKMNIQVIEKNYSKINEELPNDRQYGRAVLFMRGEYSNYIQIEDFPLIKKLFPSAEVVTIKKAGHWVHADSPAEFADRVIEFLKHA